MKVGQEQLQPESMELNEPSSNDYAYRPLTTKHRRAGSTGTTGDEEYTTDEDELYTDETDCAIIVNTGQHSLFKSDLTRAATDLFGYATKSDEDDKEPTSLFDDDDNNKLTVETSSSNRKESPSPFTYDDELDISIGDEKSTTVQTQDKLMNEEAGKSIYSKQEKDQIVIELEEELKKAHEKLKSRDEEVSRLSRIRQDVEAELEELTASLFQEAHNMVREANIRQATAERLLEESRMKGEVLAAEVVALKTLVLTSTPARPNPHLHPQIDTEGHQGLFTKRHRRSPSHFNLKYGRESSPGSPDSPVKEQRSAVSMSDKEIYEGELQRERDKEKEKEYKDISLEVDPRLHNEFLRWKGNPCVDKSDPFVGRIFKEDIDLCLDFPNKELTSKLKQAVLDGIIFIEVASDKTKLPFPKKCALLAAPRQCHYRMRLGDQENQWFYISRICRNRVIAVCDFLNYLRYIERGLVKSSSHDVYWEITRLRKEMVLARLGLALSS